MSANPTRVLVLLLLGCNADDPQDNTAQKDPSPTYYADAKAIVDAKCATCHQPGDIGPFSLQTYEEVKDFEASVRSSIEHNTMPPWMPADDCTDYVGNINLTEDERATLLAWLDNGAPEGSPADSPNTNTERADTWTADLTLQLPEPYTPQLEPDDYRCQLIEWPYDEPVYVTGPRVEPDQRAIVHHTIACLIGPDQVEQFRAWDEAEAGPGYTCYGGPTASTSGGMLENLDTAEVMEALDALGVTLAELRAGELTTEQMMALFEELGMGGSLGFSTLGSWVPGTPNLTLPEGTGILVEPGSMVVAQMHYNTLSSDPVADQSRIDLAIAETVERRATTLPAVDLGWISNGLLGPAMTIPAGEPEVTHSTTIDYDSLFVEMTLSALELQPGAPLVIHNANHHMRDLGTSRTSTVRHADGTQSCPLDIPEWDFNWQGAYQLAEPVVLRPGDSVEVSCTWDNSAANQPVVDGEVREPEDVSWGEGTSDEMCLAAYYVTGQ